MPPCTCPSTGFIVVGEVLLGRRAATIYGDELHATAENAEFEMSEIAVGLGIEGRGVSLLVHAGDLPAAIVVTADGRLWSVRVLKVRAVAPGSLFLAS
jgi:hypothetical protein